jgi:hypothetical protein
VTEPAIPRLPSKDGDAELNRVDQDYSSPPRINAGQFHGRPQSLGENATSRDPRNDEHVHAGMIAGSRAIALIDNFLPDH